MRLSLPQLLIVPLLSLVLFFSSLSLIQAADPTPTPAPGHASCGTRYDSTNPLTCDCASGEQQIWAGYGVQVICCGWWYNDTCYNNEQLVEDWGGVTDQTFNKLNPLKIFHSDVADELSTPRGIISRVLAFAFPLAGLILFIMIVWGGFEMILGASSKKSMDSGRQRITAAIVGFLLLFSSYWIISILEQVFRIRIL